MLVGRKLSVMLAMIIATFAVAGGLVVRAPEAAANDQCIQRCIQLENQCRRNSKGQGNCDAVAAQCMASCRQPK